MGWGGLRRETELRPVDPHKIPDYFGPDWTELGLRLEVHLTMT
jgi:hypothetical protein